VLEQKHPHEPHWYLGALGVEPDRQGNGVGTALLEEILAICDRECEGAYLEASRPESARLYERLGFEHQEVLEPSSIGVGGPRLYLMYRPRRKA
jgi:ribosomal protein S18 acetylase RimI-like enzyme